MSNLKNFSNLNIVILGIGHANTTITTQQLSELGFNVGDVNKTFYELSSIVNINKKYLNSGEFDTLSAKSIIDSLKEPWVIKDPRFAIGTLNPWIEILLPYNPILLWIRKDLRLILKSYKKRNQKPDMNQLKRWENECFLQYNNWPLLKFSVNVDQIARACSLFNFYEYI